MGTTSLPRFLTQPDVSLLPFGNKAQGTPSKHLPSSEPNQESLKELGPSIKSL